MARTALITGASGGIGSAVCEVFATSGLEIIGIDKVPSEWTRGHSFSLENPNLSEELRSTFPLDGLTTIVHAGAVQVFGDMHEETNQVWQNALLTNVLSLNNLVSRFRTELVANRGSVVAVGSVHSISSRRGIGVYAVSKSALEGWVRAASLELAPAVRVNSVVPGAIQAGALMELIENSGDTGPSIIEKIRMRSPLQRIGTPRDVANAVAFLASESASFITGQSLVVDGGALGLLGTEVE